MNSVLSALTGAGVTHLWSRITAAFAAKVHNHSAADVNSGILPVIRGGTGRNDAVPVVYVDTLPDTADDGVVYVTPI